MTQRTKSKSAQSTTDKANVSESLQFVVLVAVDSLRLGCWLGISLLNEKDTTTAAAINQSQHKKNSKRISLSHYHIILYSLIFFTVTNQTKIQIFEQIFGPDLNENQNLVLDIITPSYCFYWIGFCKLPWLCCCLTIFSLLTPHSTLHVAVRQACMWRCCCQLKEFIWSESHQLLLVVWVYCTGSRWGIAVYVVALVKNSCRCFCSIFRVFRCVNFATKFIEVI